VSRRLPDFIIGGAPRSGTTWLYMLLDRHPQIYMAKPMKPEPKFFLVDHLYEQGIEHYARTWFGDVPAARVAGEKSTDYLESATAAARIHQHLPDVKLVFILREPVERAFSNYLWTRMNGLETETFQRALELEEERERTLPERLKFARPYAYVSRGLYAELLEPYIARFPREQMLILKFEDLVADPRSVATALHTFLGVEERPEDAAGLGTINPSQKVETLDEATRRWLAARYAGPNRQLAHLLGPSFHVWHE
jgi:hypothetical protein